MSGALANTRVTSRPAGASAIPLDVTILDASGNPIVTFGGSGGTASTVGAAFPGTATAAGFIDSSGNMAGANLDAGGNLKVSGSLVTTPPASATSALSNVSGSASSVTVLASNANRLGFVLYNDSTSAVNVKLGAVASATSFTKRMLPNEQWDTNDLGVNYNGKIDAIWDSATGTMRVTELTA